MKKWAKAILILMVICVALIMSTAIYAYDYYRAVGIESYITSSDKVAVTQTDNGYFFDGPGTENVLIFYPGGKVDEKAYAPILNSLSEKGVDCFLLKMPLHLAVFDGNKAEEIVSGYDYEHYYLAGHSLGGVMASNYSASHKDDVSGLFMLGAYTVSNQNDAKYPVVFIYGTNDKVLNREKLEESFSLVPSDYSVVEIEGGNHAQFGSYGEQKGDGDAAISAEEQWKITVDTIIKAIY